MWNGYYAYKMYVAFHIHFTRSEKYDIRSMNYGEYLKLPKETFEKRKDKRLFDVLAMHYTAKELFSYYVGNFLYGNTQLIYEQNLGKSNYNKWIGNKERLTYLVNVDLKTIAEKVSEDYLSEKFTKAHTDDELENLKSVGNIWRLDPICMFNMYKAGLINIETMIALDKVGKVVDSFRSMYPEMAIICEPDYMMIRKANIFLRLNPQITETINNFLRGNRNDIR